MTANDHLAQARRLALQGKFAEAYRIYESLLPTGSARIYAEYGKAKYAEHTGASLEEAVALFLRASQSDDSSTDALLWLADVYAIGYGDGYLKVAELYRALTQVEETATDAYIGLGLLRGAPSNPVSHDEAIAAFRRATELAPNRLDARIDLVSALLEADRLSEAQEVLPEAERLAADAGEQALLSAMHAAGEQIRQGRAGGPLVFLNDSPRYEWFVAND